MKKLFIILSIIIPFLGKSQDVFLYGSTNTPTNNVVARNNFSVTGTFFLGQKDTTFSPSKTGALVVRPQDGKAYLFILNPGGPQWWALGFGTQTIYSANMMHARNDSTFVFGGRADSTTTISLVNTYSFTIDSATAGVNKGFKVNFGSDAPWDLITRDSITGYWTRIPAPSSTIGMFLKRVSGGWSFAAASGGGGSSNLTGTPNTNTYVVSNDNGTGFTIPAATQSLAGLYTSAMKQRGDSTVYVVNSHNMGGDTLSLSSLGRDTFYLRDYLTLAGTDIIIDSSQSSLFSIVKKFSVDTTVANGHVTTYGFVSRNYLPLALASGNFIVGNGSGVGTPVVISGDFTINNAGVGSIGAGKITNTMLAGSIAYTKLSLSGAILNTDLAGSITASKLVGTDITTVGTVSGGTWNASVIVPSYGGTGIASYGIGDILAATTATVLSKVSDVAAGNVLLSGGIGVIPAYGKVGLQTHVNGTLQPANGGTGIASLSPYGLIVAGTTNTGVFQQVSGTGNSGDVLTSNGASALSSWQSDPNMVVYSLAVNTANYTLTTANFVRLTDLTGQANRSIILPSVPTKSQQNLIIKNLNTSSFNWTFSGATVLDALDASVSIVPTGSIIVLKWDGTNYNITQ